MKRTILVFFLLLLQVALWAQNKIDIQGKVTDASTNETLIQAQVQLLRQNDSAFVQGTATNTKGEFKLTASPGAYILKFSYVGYADLYKNINAQQIQNQLGTVALEPNSVLLQETVIKGKAVEIIVKDDTLEYNADSYKVLPSAVVEDLIKKMPGAEVDDNGKITINGKEIKKILVDGKEFFSDDPKVASKNLPAAMVDKLQVYDRRSDISMLTGFDDGDEEAVINLTVKPGMKQGAFGNAYAGYGSDNRYEANASINYMQDNTQVTLMGGANNTNNAGFSDFASDMFGGMRPPRGMNFGGRNGITSAINAGGNFATEFSEKLKLGGNVRFGTMDNHVESESYTEYVRKEGQQDETKSSVGDNISKNFGANFRMEWNPDSMTTLIFQPSMRYNVNTNSQISNAWTIDHATGDSITYSETDYFSDGDGYTLDARLDFSRKLNSRGATLSLQLSGGLNNSDSEGHNINPTYEGANILSRENTGVDLLVTETSRSYNYRGYLSFVQPIGKNNFLQLAYDFRKSHSLKDKISKDRLTEITDQMFSNKTENDFTNQSIGLNFKAVRSKYDLTAGFAALPSRSSTSIDGEVTEVNVWNYSPVMQFNYRWNKQTNLRVDYNGRSSAPSATQLSTAINASDLMNASMGNPDLKPTFTNRLNVRFQKFVPDTQTAYMLWANVNYILNDIVNTTIYNYPYQTDTGIYVFNRLRSYTNVDGNWSGRLRFMFNTPLKNKKFSINSATIIDYDRTKSFVDSLANLTNKIVLTENAGISYRSDLFDVTLRGNVGYTGLVNSLQSENDRNVFNYGGNFSTTWYLPWDLVIDSDINYSGNSGYTDGFKQNEWLWNASLGKQLFSDKAGLLRIKFYDILKQRSSISRSTGTDYFTDTQVLNNIPSYFIVHFTYKFQVFKGGAKRDDMQRMGPGGGGPPPGGGGRFF